MCGLEKWEVGWEGRSEAVAGLCLLRRGYSVFEHWQDRRGRDCGAPGTLE